MYKVLRLFGGGSVINGATLSKLVGWSRPSKIFWLGLRKKIVCHNFKTI